MASPRATSTHTHVLAALVILVPLVACGGTSDAPSAPTNWRWSSGTTVFPAECVPASNNQLLCSVELYDPGLPNRLNYTASANWRVVPNAFSLETSPVAVATAPGLITPATSGEICVLAEVPGANVIPPNHGWRVDPNRPPVRLMRYVQGFVSDAGAGAALEGVTVDVVSPEVDRGKQGITKPNGVFTLFNFDFDVPFTLRASKPGYETQTVTFPPLRDDFEGSLVTLPIKLSRAQ